MKNLDFDYVIIGSGFGGSVSALRLSEKGYKVLVIEKGKWFKSEDFPDNNWQLKKWIWEPKLGLKGFFKMTFLNHATVLSGVGVGGGSLTYANTLPIPTSEFFKTGSWASLNNWENLLQPFYKTAYKMLGAEENPKLFDADKTIQDIAKNTGKELHFEPTKVAVYFGETGKTVKDPYFNGKGPDRTGCIHCGACMTGCKFNAKNTLDKNYLHLAQLLGAEILAEKEVVDVKPSNLNDGSEGYSVTFKSSLGKTKIETIATKGVVFAGGVLGTVPLLLKLKSTSLPNLSDCVGRFVRTNNESLHIVTSTEKNPKDFSKGIAIGSILHTDENSHLEPVRYGEGSGFFRILSMPFVYGTTIFSRILGLLKLVITKPRMIFKTLFAKNYAQRSTVLLFMQTLDSTLRIKLGKITKMKTEQEEGATPSAFIPEAMKLSEEYGKLVNGIPYANVTDMLLGTPTTAHILGGVVMGENSLKGVIDKNCNVFNYRNMLVCDGSIISANPGVNPSLSITAISEYAMNNIPNKSSEL